MTEVKNDFKTMMISGTIVIVSAIIGASVYNINDRMLMSKNIDNAIAKGVDPLSVRCAFADGRDMICVAYGASHGNVLISKK
jgi:hypothetical protein